MKQPSRKLSGLSIEELIQRARAGEQGAIEELLRRYQDEMNGWAEKSGCLERPGGVRPSDISQEAALRAYQRFASFEGSSQGEFVQWVKAIVLHQAEQMLREAGRQKRSPVDLVPLDVEQAQEVAASQPTPSQQTARAEEWRLVQSKLFSLKKERREAVRLYFVEGMTRAQVAELLGKTPTAVDNLLSRGVTGLRERVEAEPNSAVETAFIDWLRQCELGGPVDAEAFIALHAGCADELREMIRWGERLRSLKPFDSSK